VAGDIRLAIESGSNVLTTAEEAAYPWAAHGAIAAEVDALARQHGVSVLGAGVNPGFAFDALVLTASGACWDVASIAVKRVVNLSGFSEAILARLGVGYGLEEFEQRAERGEITGHIGFPQSMRVVAGALGVAIERIDRVIEPVLGERDYERQKGRTTAGTTAGFRQHYVAVVDGAAWFDATFTGHLEPSHLGLAPLDSITIEGSTPVHMEMSPGLNPQQASTALVANSLRRLVAARPGWLSVADLPPATSVPAARP
jgi:4-hydroxy-tetrahydrodipicolinate reductase